MYVFTAFLPISSFIVQLPFCRVPQDEAVLRDSWVELLLKHLNLHPKRASLFWSTSSSSTAVDSTSTSSSLSSLSSQQMQPNTPISEIRSTPKNSSDDDSSVSTRLERGGSSLSSTLTKNDSELEIDECEPIDVIENEQAVKKTEELFGCEGVGTLSDL